VGAREAVAWVEVDPEEVVEYAPSFCSRKLRTEQFEITKLIRAALKAWIP